MFDVFTNATFIADMLSSSLMHTSPLNTSPLNELSQISFDGNAAAGQGPVYTQWSPNTMKEIRNFDMSPDSIYVTSPGMGFSASQYNRSNGVHVMNIEDA